MAADQDILSRIHELVDEEHQLRSGGAGADPARLKELERQLDQCWDLLRQRRAKREFGLPETDAHVRSTDTVERYQG